MVISFTRTIWTNPGSIPNEELWNLQVPEGVPIDLEGEFISLTVEKRGEELVKNKNVLSDSIIHNETACSDFVELIDPISVYIINERNENDDIRTCMKCKKFKPDRSHHCRHCGTCILKMDHHCPWVGNCIGFRNYKYFVNMIFWALVNSAYFNLIFSGVIRYLIVEEKIVTLKLICFLVLYFFMIMVMLGLSMFNLFHFWITVKNYTTFEFASVFTKGRNQDPNKMSRYDIGYWENFKQVYGSNPLLWFIPVDGVRESNWHNGINFKVASRYEYEVVKSF
jgi:hypothetical protein